MTEESPTQAFLAVLNRLRELMRLEHGEFDCLLTSLFLALGSRNLEGTVDDLEDRIGTLVKREGLDEVFLVMGLVVHVTNELERAVIEHGEDIVRQEETLRQIEGDPAEGDKTRLMSICQKRLARLKEPGYLIRRTLELDGWNHLVALRFGRAHKMVWRDRRAAEAAERYEHAWESVPAEVRELIEDIPFGKLRDEIPFGDLQRLTVEQARLLRKKLRREE